MAPFYPLQAKEKGVSVFYVGFVLGSNAVAYIAGSMFASNFLHFDWYGRERAMVIGWGSPKTAQVHSPESIKSNFSGSTVHCIKWVNSHQLIWGPSTAYKNHQLKK